MLFLSPYNIVAPKEQKLIDYKWEAFALLNFVSQPNKNMQLEQLLDPPRQYLSDIFVVYSLVLKC